MLQVIGFEGPSGEHLANFGCAAISDSQSVWNACSRAKCSIEKWNEHVREGAVTACPPSPQLPGAVHVLPCMVLRTPSTGPLAELLDLDREKHEVLEQWGGEGWVYTLFPNLERLKAFTVPIAPTVLKIADEESRTKEERERLQAAAYVFNRELSPTLQRLRSLEVEPTDAAFRRPTNDLRDLTTEALLAEVDQHLAPEDQLTCEACPRCGEALATTLSGGRVVDHVGGDPHTCWDRQVKFLSVYGLLRPNEYVFRCDCGDADCDGFRVARESGYHQHHIGEWSEEERVTDLLRETARRLAERDMRRP